MSTQSPDWITAARVLRRIGFGACGAEVDAAVAAGAPEDYVRASLDADFDNDPGLRATPMPDFDIPESPGDDAGESDTRRYRDLLAGQRHALPTWWIQRMIAVENPAREKLTFLWHNHFATSAAKVKIAHLMAGQNATLRRHCLGDFRTLAYAMLTDPAMITWLDGQQNKVGSANENLAREFMELFVLGHANGYSERDVREGARALTGWTVDHDGHSTLVPARHDDSTKELLGASGDFAAEEFCDLVLASAGSARFVADRLWGQLASDEPPSERVVARLTTAFGPDHNLHALTVAILTDPEFLANPATIVVGPVDWLIGMTRSLAVNIDAQEHISTIISALTALGQLPFYPPDVGGWPRGRAWLSTSGVDTRLRTSSRLVKDGDISVVDEAPARDRVDAVGYLIGVGSWTDRSADVLNDLSKNPAALVSAAVNTPEYLTT